MSRHLLQALRITTLVVTGSLWLAGTERVYAHPGSGIAADAQGNIYFVDTGRGVWKFDVNGKLTLIHTLAYHWMAIDEKGHFANSHALGNFDRGSFERVTPAGALPALVVASDYPIALGEDGGLHYVLSNQTGNRELIRRMPGGQRSVVAVLPRDTGPEPMLWVNGITTGPAGSIYLTDNDLVRKVDGGGKVSTVRGPINPNDCTGPLSDSPKLPYLRGLAVARDGTIYAAANGCRSVISIPVKGAIKTVLKAERPWSPTGVVLSGDDLYVLEYLHTSGDNRKEWIPRVRKVTRGGKITTVVTVAPER